MFFAFLTKPSKQQEGNSMTDKNMEKNVPNESLYTTVPVFRTAVDGLESSTKDYLEYYNNLSPEKKAAEVYFWQEFVSSLD